MLTIDAIKGKIRRTYILAACAIALLMTMYFAWTQQYLMSTQIQPKIINIAGKQRMLSQRIAFLQTLLVQESEPLEKSKLKNELIARTSEFLRSHEVLVGRQSLSGQFTPLSADLEQLYFGSESNLDTKALNYGESAMQLASASADPTQKLTPVDINRASAMLAELDRAVQLFEYQLSGELRFNQMMLMAVWFITTVLSLLIILFLFRPLRNMVIEQFQVAQESRKDMLSEREHTTKIMSSNEELLASMSYEFRTPVSSIIGALELLPNSQGKQASLIRKAEHACYQLLILTNNLIDSLPLSSGGSESSSEDFDLIRLLDDAYSEFIYNCQQNNLNYQITNESSLPQLVNGYPNFIVKALKSVLDNAVKFTPHGSVSVYNRITISEGTRFLIIRVVDTGIGIRNTELDSIFERFTKAYDPSLTFSGTGTGLYTARTLLGKAGGTISVTSALHTGSEFTLTIPLASPDNSDEKVAKPSSPVRFAVVDDQEITRIHLASMIEVQGCLVDTYKSGADLLANQEKLRTYSCIITDYYMPGINGVELINYLQAMLGTNMPPVMIISASPQVANLVGNSGITAWQMFVKPIDKNRFEDAVKYIAEGHIAKPTAERNLSILVVEDETINAEILYEMLDNMGHDVSLAADGESALLKASESFFDVILLDLQLPDISGFEVAELLRERGCQSHIVSVTASAYPSDRQKALDAGIRYHLVKPVSYQELKSTLKLLMVPHQPV